MKNTFYPDCIQGEVIIMETNETLSCVLCRESGERDKVDGSYFVFLYFKELMG